MGGGKQEILGCNAQFALRAGPQSFPQCSGQAASVHRQHRSAPMSVIDNDCAGIERVKHTSGPRRQFISHWSNVDPGGTGLQLPGLVRRMGIPSQERERCKKHRHPAKGETSGSAPSNSHHYSSRTLFMQSITGSIERNTQVSNRPKSSHVLGLTGHTDWPWSAVRRERGFFVTNSKAPKAARPKTSSPIQADKVRKPQNIQDLARIAGVSAATVSRALAGTGDTSRHPRVTVFEPWRRSMGSGPAIWRETCAGRTGTVGVIVPLGHEKTQHISDPFFMTLLAYIADRISIADMTCF